MSQQPGGPSWFQDLHWDRPWLARWRGQAPGLSAALAAGCSVAGALNRLAEAQAAAGRPPLPVRFVTQDRLPPGQAYEDFIARERCVPTRDNLHDLFNGLAWLAFPQTKARLNALQAAQIAAGGIGATRGAVRDALTLFDENAAIVHAPAPLVAALRARDWQRLFIDLRPLWDRSQVLVFGHAALEKLQTPRKAITVHVYLPRSEMPPDDLDAALAADLEPAHLACKPFTPLPLLGIPGWWAANANFSFYDDSQVFRAASRAGGA